MERFFHAELEDLREKLILLGEKATEAVRLAVRALLENKVNLAHQVVAGDEEIDRLDAEIDREAMRYITLRAPKAADMRLIMVAINASQNLERVGDEATTIARRSIRLHSAEQPLYDLRHLEPMSIMVIELLDEAMRCYIDGDAVMPPQIILQDKKVDDLNRLNYQEFMDDIARDPALLKAGLEAIFISKSLERIADHAKNLAQEVAFLLSGKEKLEFTREVQRGAQPRPTE